MFLLRLAVITLLLTTGALAQDSALRTLSRADEARGWTAVGRVNVGRDGFCTGTLIKSNIVLTAAHCFFNAANGRRVPDAQVRFVAGWSGGSAESIRGARKVAIHPDYKYPGPITTGRISRDIALIELDQPILDTAVRPFDTASLPVRQSAVTIVSYARGRTEIPSIQDVCHVLGATRNVLTLTCDVTYGASGSPVFDTSSGSPKVVSVVSAIGNLGGRQVAFSMQISDALDGLFSQLTVGTATRKSVPGGQQQSIADQLGRGRPKTGLPQIGGN